MAEEDALRALTNCPFCILSLEKGLELMQESGEPIEFGIFLLKFFINKTGEIL